MEKRDPVGMYESWLLTEKKISADRLEAIEADVDGMIEDAAKLALARRETHAVDPKTQTQGVYA